jgi:hypothetical protein
MNQSLNSITDATSAWPEPFAVNRPNFLKKLNLKLASMDVLHTGLTLADFKQHLSPAGLLLLFPLNHEAGQDLLIYNQQVADAMINDLPPPEILPANIHLLPPYPTLPTIPVPRTQLAMTNYMFDMATYDAYKLQLKLFREYLMSVIPNKILISLEMKSGPDGSIALSIPEIMDYLLSPRYSEATSEELDKLLSSIDAPWSKDIALQSNLDNMLKFNNYLKHLAPDMQLSEKALFKLAFNQAKSERFALQNILTDWSKDHRYTDSLFSEFAEYLVQQNRIVLHSDSTINKAFCCEARYRPSKAPTHPLGAAADGSTEVPPATPAIGLGTKAAPPKTPNPNWTDANWKLFQKLTKTPTRPQPVVPAQTLAPGATPTVLGKICFHHGWNLTHTSPMCLPMRNNPNYTDNQRALTDYCISRDSDEIDGKKIKTFIQRGCHPNM